MTKPGKIGSIMILQQLSLQNFRRFQRLEIDFESSLTVLVARNGQGKTTVLDAITVALGTFVGAFDHGKAHHIEKSDARYASTEGSPEGVQQYPVQIEAHFNDPETRVLRELTGPKNKTTIKDASAITEIGTSLQQMVRDQRQEPLPVISYYGAGRLWKAHKNLQRKQVLSDSRTLGYEDCLSPASNFVQVQQWMAKATMAQLQQQALASTNGAVPMAERISAIAGAVEQALQDEGWSGFRYDFAHEELAMTHAEHGTLPVSLLSDGVRAMVSMVADLAFRCVRLNGYMGRRAPQESRGIVLIDEVDIHLHPAWQQRVIGSLRRAFPNLQFIVTTHSPQVLTTVPAECIRVLEEALDGSAAEARHVNRQTLGVESAAVLAEVMGTDAAPDVAIRRDLSRYLALIQQDLGLDGEAVSLRHRLDEHFGSGHPVLLDADRLMRLQQLKRRALAG
jgi:predicted ATP-binding protein involved in virulence